ncbi:N-acetyldiaminopimelate deacetylase [Aminipila butyrica]|uniref:N-acetyldiaminopimelate deacetylase n=1 Tax=Aminipila butyrica TaxID=433296 RepID=A0A858BSY3_9FIRM|nr:amidohydrolase [Aminipila butyrica]QIB68472.1 N-acetyldiaminopimelate deacetylase [Aminipila butyrica]
MTTPFNDQEMLTTLIRHHRTLHQIPEIGDQLFETQEYIMSIIGHMDCEFTTVVNTGICAFFDKGREETVAYRSDMDGLTMPEVNTHRFVSQHPGKMHGCGHDAHMSMLLGFAEYVHRTPDLPYNVLLIFQPAEETTGGARPITQSGIFEKYQVIRTFGLHLWPNLPKGQIATKGGPMMPKSSEISIEIKGKSTHAATAHKGIDALYLATQYIADIYRMQAEEIPADQRTLLKICRLNSGTARNVIAGRASLLGTMRAFKLETFDFMEMRLKAIAGEYEERYGCKISVHCSDGYLPVVNDKELYQLIKPQLNDLSYYQELPEAVMISEDFSYYGTKAPSVFALLGTGAKIPLHSNNFDFDEEILLSGYNYFKLLSHIS